jgi:hypothetical protein
MRFTNCEVVLGGRITLAGGQIPLTLASAGAVQTGFLDIDMEGNPYCGLVLNQIGDHRFEKLQISDESTGTPHSGGLPGGLVTASVSNVFCLSLSGKLNSVSTSSTLLKIGSSIADNGNIFWNMQCNATSGVAKFLGVMTDSTGSFNSMQRVQAGPEFSTNGAAVKFSNLPQYFVAYRGAGAASALGDASLTVTTALSDNYAMPASTTTAVRTITIGGTATAQPGQKIRFRLGQQGNNVLLVNGGGAGGTLVTHASGTASTVYELRFNGTDWELY